jgi:hypothetical protein
MSIDHLRSRICASLLMLFSPLYVSLAMAQSDTAIAVSARYPSGSIRSVAEADAALAAAAKERAEIEARYAAEEQACHPKFFATSCIDQAKERRRKAESAIRPVEIEANTFKRQARLDNREKALAERLAKEEKERQERASKTQAQEPAARQQDVSPPAPESTPQESPEKAEANVPSDRSAKHEAKLKRKQAEDAANAEKRAENIAAYEKKKQEALERQRKVAERKAEKEKERREKQ